MTNEDRNTLPARRETSGGEVNAIASLPPSLAIMKMENDSIMALAAARPRDIAELKEEMAATLAATPELAETAIYAKPVGKVQDYLCEKCGAKFEEAVRRGNYEKAVFCNRCDSKQCKPQGRPRMKFAEGLSIRAAEALADTFGFNRVRSDVLETGDPMKVKIEATFVDYQKGRTWSAATFISRDTGKYVISEDKFYSLNVPAAASKMIREVILRSVNPGLKAWFEGQCRKIQSTLVSEEDVNKLAAAFLREHKIDLNDLEDLIGRTVSEGWTNSDVQNLRGVFSGLKNGEMTVDELFEDLKEERAAEKPRGKAPAALTSPTGRAETKPAPTRTKQPTDETIVEKPTEEATQPQSGQPAEKPTQDAAAGQGEADDKAFADDLEFTAEACETVKSVNMAEAKFVGKYKLQPGSPRMRHAEKAFDARRTRLANGG